MVILFGGARFFGGAGDANPQRILNFCNICPLVQQKNLPWFSAGVIFFGLWQEWFSQVFVGFVFLWFIAGSVFSGLFQE